jgi:hypothetical protein
MSTRLTTKFKLWDTLVISLTFLYLLVVHLEKCLYGWYSVRRTKYDAGSNFWHHVWLVAQMGWNTDIPVKEPLTMGDLAMYKSLGKSVMLEIKHEKHFEDVEEIIPKCMIVWIMVIKGNQISVITNDRSRYEIVYGTNNFYKVS